MTGDDIDNPIETLGQLFVLDALGLIYLVPTRTSTTIIKMRSHNVDPTSAMFSTNFIFILFSWQIISILPYPPYSYLQRYIDGS